MVYRYHFLLMTPSHRLGYSPLFPLFPNFLCWESQGPFAARAVVHGREAAWLPSRLLIMCSLGAGLEPSSLPALRPDVYVSVIILPQRLSPN